MMVLGRGRTPGQYSFDAEVVDVLRASVYHVVAVAALAQFRHEALVGTLQPAAVLKVESTSRPRCTTCVEGDRRKPRHAAATTATPRQVPPHPCHPPPPET